MHLATIFVLEFVLSLAAFFLFAAIFPLGTCQVFVLASVLTIVCFLYGGITTRIVEKIMSKIWRKK